MNQLQSFLTALKPKNDGDIVDRMLYYTVIILALVSLLLFGWSFFGTPIQCWFPVQFTEFWNEYALDYCYVQNTYFESFLSTDATAISPYHNPLSDFIGQHSINHWISEDSLSDKTDISQAAPKRDAIITYYQWVPFVLALMAIAFHLPSMFWRFIYGTTSSAKDIFSHLREANGSLEPADREKCANIVGFLLHNRNKLFFEEKKANLFARCTLTTFILVKFFSFLLCVCQFFWLERFLGLDDHFWGFTVFYDLYKNRSWTETGHFPRVTFCDLKVRELANIHQHTIQCVLLINMLNEKIFVFLWFWFICITFIALISFCYWLVFACFYPLLRRNIFAHVNLIDKSTAERDSKCYSMAKRFLTDSFDSECLFLLSLIEMNDGSTRGEEVIRAMWNQYKKWNYKKFQLDVIPKHVQFKLDDKPLKFRFHDKESSLSDYATLPSHVRLPRYEDSV